MNTPATQAGRSVYRLAFTIPVDMEAVEQTLLLAVLAVGCLHGESAVRLDAGYAIDAGGRVVVIDAGTQIGCAVARVFIGFCAREFGDDTFRVERVGGASPVGPRAGDRAEAVA